MNKSIFLLASLSMWILLCPSIGLAKTFSGTWVSASIPVVGRIDNATQSWSGSLIANFDTSKDPISVDVQTTSQPYVTVKVGTPTESSEMYYDNLNEQFKGFFVLTAACATTNCQDTSGNWDTSAFITFDHWVWSAKAQLIQDDPAQPDGTYSMKWFAWSKSSGWIWFWIGSQPVKYDRGTWEFSGFAWSKNLGYISMSGLKMFSKPPKIVSIGNVAVADHQAHLGSRSGSIDDLGAYRLLIDYSDSAWQDWLPPSLDWDFWNVDIKHAKDYAYTLVDPFGNISSSDINGKLKVVANVPVSWGCWSHSISPLPVCDPQLVIGNNAGMGETFDLMKLTLHDTYGNPVLSESWIKDVKTTIKIVNKISPNQTDFSTIDSKTLYVKTNFEESIEFSGNLGATFNNTRLTSTDGEYEIMTGSNIWNLGKLDLGVNIFNPTNSTNTLSIGKVTYEVISNTGGNVWSVTETDITPTSPNNQITVVKDIAWIFQIKPVPAWSQLGLNLPFETESTFTPTSTPANLFGADVYQYYQVRDKDNTTDIHNFVTLSWTTKTDMNWYYEKKDLLSNFNLIPQALDSLNGVEFKIKHQALRTHTKWVSAATYFAYKIGNASDASLTQNRGIKIIGTTSTSNSGSIFALNTQDEYTKIGNFSKPQVKDFVQQNVEAIIRNPSSDTLLKDNASPELDSGNSDSWQSKQTIIVRNKDLIISTDVPALSNGKPRAIIVINWDIKITSAVQSIQASIFTNKWLYAIDSTGSPIDDSSRSSQQLYIFGTLISGNTVGTSAQSANGGACPDFLPKTCSPDQKKQYDLNFLRTGPSSGNVVVSEYPEYPVVIRYNPKLTSDPPPGFKKIAR